MERLLGFDAQLLFDSAVTAVNLFLLFFVLSYFLFNPVKDALNERKKKIEGDLAAATEAKRSAIFYKEEYEEKLKLAEQEADIILEKATKRARVKTEEMIEEARQEATRIGQRAEKEMQLERTKAEDELKKEVVAAASLMAARVVAGIMDAATQDALIERVLEGMGDVTWQAR